MARSFALHETAIKFTVTMKTINDDGEAVTYGARPGDHHHIEFRRPSGIWEPPRLAEYDEATGEVAYDLGASHADLLTETGPWEFRAVLVRSDRSVIKTTPSDRFWVVP